MTVSIHTTHGPMGFLHMACFREHSLFTWLIYLELFSTLVSFLSKPYTEAIKAIILKKITKFQESFESF